MSFNEFIKEQNSELSLQKEIKRREVIAAFGTNLKGLYDRIENDWLKEYIDRKQVIVTRKSINIIEEKLGEYTVEELHIQIANQEVILSPKGTNMIGTDARVDIYYLGIQRVQLVRVGELIDNPMQMISIKLNGEVVKKRVDGGAPVWKAIKGDTRRTLVKLTKASFEQILMDVINNG